MYPYPHPWLYLLDLCILSYQLHSQTLAWPMDPYYEQWGTRNDFMAQVRKNIVANKYQSFLNEPNTKQYRNAQLDPTMSDYSQLDPWQPGVTRPNAQREGWLLYQTPTTITDTINSVHMYSHNFTLPWDKAINGNDKAIHGDFGYKKIKDHPQPHLFKTDELYCFEGGTGGVRKNPADPAQSHTWTEYPAWSMMGFVLARSVAPPPKKTPYDVYIVFRGSRSGNSTRVVPSAFFLGKGNADWVTDWNFGARPLKLVSDQQISKDGHVSPGFANSMTTMLPIIMQCLKQVHADRKSAPRDIYVTGHSLGSALAVHFTSAVLLGDKYGHKGGHLMPDEVKTWPWERPRRGHGTVRLVTFGSPVVGGSEFTKAFDARIPSRRINLKWDLVAQDKRGHHTGLETEIQSKVMFPSAHEPYKIREELIRHLKVLGELDETKYRDALKAAIKDAMKITHPNASAADVLTETAKADILTKTPWEICKDFKTMFGKLASGNFLASTFNKRLLDYLDVFHANTKDDKVKRYIDNLKTTITDIDANLVKPSAGTTLIRNAKDFFPNEKDIVNFLSLSLVMSINTKSTRSNMAAWLEKDGYKSLR